MTLNEKTNAFTALGQKLQSLLKGEGVSLNKNFEKVLIDSFYANKWFDEKNLKFALSQIVEMLKEKNLNKWLSRYDAAKFNTLDSKRVGVVMAGNIPLVGFHDFLCVLISGHIFIGKLSSQDKILLPYIADLLIKIDERFREYIFFKDDLRDGFEAVIATGSNNSSRYFDYYFSKFPHIIRKNRNSIAVLSGNETLFDLDALSDDICLYYGKGCRSVSKIYVPHNYNFEKLFDALAKHAYVIDNVKYFNNYEYYKSIYIINNTPFKDNGFMILKEQESFSSPVSVLYYEFYNDIQEVNSFIAENKQNLQCVVSQKEKINNMINFGKTQKPDLWDYADEVDTLNFLIELQ